MEISGLTKYLGIPSLATLGLGGGLLAYSTNASNRYENFIEETHKTVPIIKELDATEKTVGNLNGANRALTYYVVNPTTVTLIHQPNGMITTIITPEIDHSPSTDESVNKLQSARNNIEQKDFSNKAAILSISTQIKKVQTELEQTEKGKPENFYTPHRDKISGVKADAEEHVTKLREEIPGEILQTRDSLKNEQKNSGRAGVILGFFGVIGSAGYGLCRFADWLDGRSVYKY